VADARGAWFTPLTAPLTTADFSPDGTRLATGLLRSPGKVWQLDRTADGYTMTAVCETTEPFSAVRFCREGKTLLGIRANRSVVLLDPATGVERAVLAGHADRIVGLGLTPRDLSLVTVGKDGTVKRWNAEPSNRFVLWDRPPLQITPYPPPVPPAVVR
jgi:WD40 repeat protein